jgi:Domain of unknown function (DUF4303)
MRIDDETLRGWLSSLPSPVAAVVVRAVRTHVAALDAHGIDFYGYALLPGEPYDIHSLVAAYACESEIKVARDNAHFPYYKYCVAEWQHFEHEGFGEVNDFLNHTNAQYASMRTRDGRNYEYEMDEFAPRYSDALLEGMIQGLAAAKDAGVFGSKERFLAVWITDSNHEVIVNSVRRLNAAAVAGEFVNEFG